MRKISALFNNNQKFLPLMATISLFFTAYVVGAFAYPQMRDPQVFLNLFITSPFLLISAVGMTFVILGGGIDLSVSGMIALVSVASAALLRNGMDAWLVMLLMILMSMSIGAVMGAFITYLKVQPFIATLAGMWFARGMCFFISDDAIPISNRTYRILAQTKLLIPGLADPVTQTGAYINIPVVMMVLVLAAALYIAHFTRFGRNVYAIGGNEQSARLMGLPVNSTKMTMYILNGFCSALAGITFSMYVMSGHGLYAPGFEMTVIAAVIIGGTVLTGGKGYMFGTLFGVLITGLIQFLIQFNGKLSSWWTSIAIGALTLIFIGVQSLLAARQNRMIASQRMGIQTDEMQKTAARTRRRTTQLAWLGGAALILVVLGGFALRVRQSASLGAATDTPASTSRSCQIKPFRQDQAEAYMKSGAVITYERNGGSTCIEELYAFFPDGKIEGDNGVEKIEKQISSADVMQLLQDISDQGWFTAEMYSTWHTPCLQCFTYYITISFRGEEKTIQAVDGGTDAPASYWQVVSLINGLIPKFAP